MIFWPLIF